MLVLVSDHVAPDQQDLFATVHAARLTPLGFRTVVPCVSAFPRWGAGRLEGVARALIGIRVGASEKLKREW
eukprot:3021419-Alexandrium_andersonii.AAC.1